MFLMDRDFECISDSLSEEANLNTTTTNDNVPDIERKKPLIKECARALISTFTFKNIPFQIIIELIRSVVLWINQEPSDNGLSDMYSPRNITMGQYIAYDKH